METVNIFISKLTLKPMATFQQFQELVARFEAASKAIIENQGISATQEDQLLSQLEAQVVALENVGQSTPNEPTPNQPSQPQEPETPPVIEPGEPSVPPVIDTPFNPEGPVNPESPTNPDQL